MDRPFLFVDAKNVAYRCFVPEETFSTKDGTRTDLMHIGFKILSKLARDHQPRRVYLIWDNGPAWWRRVVHEGYKVKVLDEYMSGTKQEIEAQTPGAKEFFEKFGMINVEAPGEEADDIIAKMVDQHAPCLIVSSDSDFYQLVSDSVHIYNPRKHETITPEWVLENEGVPPCQYAAVKAVVGDTSDVITGIKGVGWKTALKLWQPAVGPEVTDLTEMLSLFHASLQTAEGKRARDILTGWATVKRNLALIHMGIYPETPGIVTAMNDAMKAVPTFQREGAIAALKKYEMIQLLADINTWVPVFRNLPDVQEV